MARIDSSFLILRATATFVMLDQSGTTIRTEHCFELEAKRPDRFYVREFNWVSAEGLEKPPIIYSGGQQSGINSHRLHGPVLVGVESDRVEVIDLGRIIDVGDTETIEIEHFFISTNPKNPWFVGHISQEGCTEITLRAILPNGVGHRIRRRALKPGASRSYMEEELESTSVGKLLAPLRRPEGWREYRWTVPEPIRGEKYRIEWDI